MSLTTSSFNSSHNLSFVDLLEVWIRDVFLFRGWPLSNVDAIKAKSIECRGCVCLARIETPTHEMTYEIDDVIDVGARNQNPTILHVGRSYYAEFSQ